MAKPEDGKERRLLYTSPWTIRPSPYLDMLYSRADEFGFRVVGKAPYRDMARRLHTAQFHFPEAVTNSVLMSIANILFILSCKVRGIQVAYIIHNLRPHDRTGLFRRVFEKLLYAFADLLIFHARFVGDHLREVGLEGPNNKLVYIPHPTYKGYVPETEKVDIRTRHSIPEDASILLVFGMVRKYKGIEEIMDAFSEVLGDRNELFLVILGTASDGQYIEELKRDHPTRNVVFENELVDDEYLFSFFKEATGTVYAQRDITTSGAAIMSVTQGVPMVHPNVAHYRDLGRVGVPYETRDELSGAIRELLELSPKETEAIRSHQRDLAKKWRYDEISRLYFELISKGGRT